MKEQFTPAQLIQIDLKNKFPALVKYLELHGINSIPLSHCRKKVFQLRYYDGLTFQQIGTRMGFTTQNASINYRSAIFRINKYIVSVKKTPEPRDGEIPRDEIFLENIVLSERLKNVLWQFKTLQNICQLSSQEILKIKGMGKKLLMELRLTLVKYNIRLRCDTCLESISYKEWDSFFTDLFTYLTVDIQDFSWEQIYDKVSREHTVRFENCGIGPNGKKYQMKLSLGPFKKEVKLTKKELKQIEKENRDFELRSQQAKIVAEKLSIQNKCFENKRKK